MEVYHGRPADADNRLPKERAVYDLLDQLGIEYKRVDHQPTQFYLLMMPGTKKFVTKEVSKMVESSRLSFADEARMEEFLNITPGSVSVMGLMNDRENRVRLLIDRDVAESEYLGCHPCVNTSSLKLRTKDMLEKFLPAVHHEYQVLELG